MIKVQWFTSIYPLVNKYFNNDNKIKKTEKKDIQQQWLMHLYVKYIL